MSSAILADQVATMRKAVEAAQQQDKLHDETAPPLHLVACFDESAQQLTMEQALRHLRSNSLMQTLRSAIEWWIFKRANRSLFKGTGLDGITLHQLVKQLPSCEARMVLTWGMNVEHFTGSEKLNVLLAHFTPLPQQQLEIERTPPWKRENKLAGTP